MNLSTRLDKISTQSTTSLVLYALYKLGDNPKYATLSELPFIINNKDLMSFFEFFGGQTIQIPKKEEFLNVISALSIYDRVDLRNQNYKKVINEYTDRPEIINIYNDLKEVLKNVEFAT